MGLLEGDGDRLAGVVLETLGHGRLYVRVAGEHGNDIHRQAKLPVGQTELGEPRCHEPEDDECLDCEEEEQEEDVEPKTAINLDNLYTLNRYSANLNLSLTFMI